METDHPRGGVRSSLEERESAMRNTFDVLYHSVSLVNVRVKKKKQNQFDRRREEKRMEMGDANGEYHRYVSSREHLWKFTVSAVSHRTFFVHSISHEHPSG